jgi:hypothetical protein
MRAKLLVVANVVLFQLCWVAFVGGAGVGRWWLGFPLLAGFAAWQLAISRWPRADVLLVVVSAILGFAMDSALVQAGLLNYAAPVPWDGLAPLWMTGLWIGFALTLNHSMAFLHGRVALAAALGALAGPFAYWVAAKAWNAVTLFDPAWQALAALGVAWGVLMPVLAELAVRLQARETRAPQPA